MDISALFSALKKLVFNPYSIFVIVFGGLVLAVNFYYMLRAKGLHKELLRTARSLEDKEPDLVHHMEFFSFAKFKQDRFMAAVSRFSNLIYKLSDERDIDAKFRNFIVFGIDALPLLGIIGTLLAISLTAFSGEPGPVRIDFQSRFGLALGSTFIALLLTIVNKMIESLWLHHYEFIENFRGLLAMYQMSVREEGEKEAGSEKTAAIG